jgi:hypothetical protein
MEKQTSSDALTNKCNATIDGNTLTTLGETASQKPTSDLPTVPKPPGPNESQNGAGSPKSVVAYKEFLITDLKLWTLNTLPEYIARHCPVEVWISFFSEYADLDPAADWTDMEERADFLTQLWTFCAQQKINFPLTEKLTQNVTVS